jgi:hypothetical protein
MDMHVDSVFGTMSIVDEFTLELAADREASYDTLLHKGRHVADVEARIVEAQFRLPDGATVVLLNDDRQFREMLTVLLVSPALTVLDRVKLGGAFTPGYLTYAYPVGPDEVAFCWHDLDQIVQIRRHRPLFGVRPRWLKVREVAMDLPNSPRAQIPKLKHLVPSVPRLPSVAWPRWPRRH